MRMLWERWLEYTPTDTNMLEAHRGHHAPRALYVHVCTRMPATRVPECLRARKQACRHVVASDSIRDAALLAVVNPISLCPAALWPGRLGKSPAAPSFGAVVGSQPTAPF